MLQRVYSAAALFFISIYDCPRMMGWIFPWIKTTDIARFPTPLTIHPNHVFQKYIKNSTDAKAIKPLQH
jgi:hypothetical protein